MHRLTAILGLGFGVGLFVGCGSQETPELSPPPNELAALQIATQGDQRLPIRLSARLEEAQIDLPASNLPADTPLPGQFPLSGSWSAMGAENNHGLRVWTHKLPVRLKAKQHARAPEGVRILVNNEAVAFANLPSSTRRAGWDINDDQILLLSKENPGRSTPPVLVMEAERALQERVNFSSSGLSGPDFVRHELTFDGVTRTGLLLPAPGALTWTLDLPEEALLELHTAMIPRVLSEARKSDGVHFAVRVGDAELFKVSLDANDEFKSHQIDLSEYSGQTVQLQFQSLSEENSDFDHLFVGEPLVWGKTEAEPRRVIIVGLDTLRYDSVTQHGYERDTTQGLQAIADRSLIFDNAYTPAPRTRPSFRTVLTGRLPYPAVTATGIAEVLRNVGFTTAGITANVHLVPRFGFNRGFDFWQFENSVDADIELKRAKTWLSENQDRDSFLFLHLMDPHNFYRAPGSYKNRYVRGEPDNLEITMNRWKVNSLQRAGKVTQADKDFFLDRYDGEVAYMADQLGEFLSWVYSLPGDTLVVLQSDHGEEFWEHGGYEHNHTLYQEVVHGLLWVIPPAGYGGPNNHSTVPTGLVDIVPTILDALDVPEAIRPATDGISLAPLFDAGRSDEVAELTSRLEARRIPIGHLMYDKERWAVVADDHKYIIQTYSGKHELYDLASDPSESKNLIQAQSPAELAHWHQALEEATGWPTGTGWRMHLLSGTEAFELEFSNPIEARTLDPESGKSRRANLMWGETAPVSPDDVAILHFNEEKTRMHVQPGTANKGRIGIVAPPDTEVTVIFKGQKTVLGANQQRVILEGLALKFVPGSVILPLDSIRNYVGTTESSGDARTEDLSALQALGYVQ